MLVDNFTKTSKEIAAQLARYPKYRRIQKIEHAHQFGCQPYTKQAFAKQNLKSEKDAMASR